MLRKIVSIALVSLILLGLLAPISSFVQAQNDLVRVIVDTVGKPTSEHVDSVEKLGGKVRYRYKLIEAIAVSLPESLIEKLREKPWVKRISLDREVHALLDVSVPTIGAKSVWGEGYDGSGIKIAICDTGIDKNHPDLKGKVVAENKFLSSIWGIMEGTEDNNGHGTHVAGIAAGTGASSGGKYKGVAPGASLINAKCLDRFGSGYLSDVIAAIEWSVDMGADVISLSIGAEGPCDGSCALCTAVDNAVGRGVVVAVAAGNSGPDPNTITCPGNAKEAITVGAADDRGTASTGDDTVSEWSGRGPTADGRVKPDVVAPGVNIMSCKYKTNSYVGMSGTSMATPHVSGAAALLLSARPDLTPAEVKRALMSTAIDLGYGENTQGAGLVDVYAAYQYVSGGLSVNVDVPSEVDLNEIFEVVATIKNNADVAATGVKATIALPAGLSLYSGGETKDIGDLASGSSGSASWQVEADSAGSYAVVVSAVDSTGGLGGEGSASVKVLKPPSIEIAEIGYSPSTIYEGNEFELKAIIKNGGDATATGVSASISFDAKGLSLVSGETPDKYVGNLAGGSTATAKWNVLATNEGQYEITVHATSTNDGDISGSTTVTVLKKPDTQAAYVGIDMSKRSLLKLMWRVTATVTVTSDGRNPIKGAAVEGHWSGDYQGTVSGTTSSSGKVSFRTQWILIGGQGRVTFTIDKVVKDGQEYTLVGERTETIEGP
ncbi:MAG: S8 family serine peptidase [Candidatus Brockarchaeota archaeon]|nr:S8 family serine peptidase [Candidatus Brockarchaeota archaeon]